MIIKNITIQHFKNIQNLSLDIDDNRFELNAHNGWGKSNTVDAILWLFTDKLRNASSDIQSIKAKPIPNDPTPSEQSKTATVIIATDVGTFQKSYYEVWKTIRGIERKVLEKHETSYMIDNVKHTKSSYENELALRLKMPLQFIPILMVADYFGKTLDYKERRKIIVDLVGDITVDEVIEEYPQLERARALFNGTLSIHQMIKTNKQEIARLIELERGYQLAIKTHETSLINKDVVAKKSALKSEQSELLKAIAMLEHKIKSIGADVTPEMWEERLKDTIFKYRQWEKVSSEKLTCISCGHVHTTKDVLEQIKKDGANCRKALENGALKEVVKLTKEENELLESSRKREREIDTILQSIYACENAIAKIKELQPQLYTTTQALAGEQQKGDLLSMYLDKWVSMFNLKANSLFESSGITFKLFDYKLNGALDETCEMLDNQVVYEKTNTASQIKLGIKLIDALKELKGYQDIPIVIDNAEAVVEKDFITNAQLIMFSAGKEN